MSARIIATRWQRTLVQSQETIEEAEIIIETDERPTTRRASAPPSGRGIALGRLTRPHMADALPRTGGAADPEDESDG